MLYNYTKTFVPDIEALLECCLQLSEIDLIARLYPLSLMSHFRIDDFQTIP